MRPRVILWTLIAIIPLPVPIQGEIHPSDRAGETGAIVQRLVLEFTEHLAGANSASAVAQRDLSVSLINLGEVLVAAGDLAGARERFERSLGILEPLAKANPSSADAQRDLLASHMKLGDLPGGEAHWTEALRIALDLQSQGRLAPSDARMIDEIRHHVAAAEKANP